MAITSPPNASAASFWSQKRQSDKASPNGAPSNGIPSTSIAPDSIAPHQSIPAKVADMKTVSTSSAPAVQSPHNSMFFKCKQLARVFEDSDDDDNDVQLSSASIDPDAKDSRIQRLEGEVAAKDARIKTLEGEGCAQDTRTQELSTTVEENELHIKELVFLSDEKARQTVQLVDELERKSKEIRHLEDKVKALENRFEAIENKVKTLEGKVDHVPLDEPAPEVPATEKSTPEKRAPKDATVVPVADSPTPNDPPPNMSESNQAPLVAQTEGTTMATPLKSPTILCRTPAPRDIIAPVFVTPDMVKSVPPVAPAPVLKFPNKNLKETTTPPKLAKVALATLKKADMDAAKGAWSATGSLPDVRNFPFEQRKELGQGPKTCIVLGEVPIQGVPKKMFMQVSEMANNFFTKQPHANQMHIPANSMVIAAARELMAWVSDVCTSPKEFSVKLRFLSNTPDADAQNIAIMSAARYLGMSTYVRHFTRHYCDEIRRQMLSLKTIALIEKFFAVDDPVFECLVNNLAHHRSKQNLPRQEQFEEFIKGHPKLAAAMEKANDAILRKRQVPTRHFQSQIGANEDNQASRKGGKPKSNGGSPSR
ncbi:hypothetical protein K505DRAFT_421163 [Melanomma pulvis-pyrius CBS 109.77]|uniref:Uncharacterized protein n=1 Tax=Melanomma pulvis-pyrius CBS 109.77 TaxID=1314802 RepID=A0A6A6WXA8_9PLEO|nr:hypothetical protein K505DRAFT_421163 [Melanomma pulvis-pyrius CBS 109.77]